MGVPRAGHRPALRHFGQFTALEVLDGMGATKASLDPEKFEPMIDEMALGGD